jgi:hypothetical protein
MAAGLARLVRLRERQQQAQEGIRRGQEQATAAKALYGSQSQVLLEAEAHCQALRERLQGMGFAEIEDEVRALTLRLDATRKRREVLLGESARRGTDLGRDKQGRNQLSAQTEAASSRQSEAIRSLEESLTAYPNLRLELDRSRATFDFATEAANQLLRFRRTENIDVLEGLVLKSLDDDKNALFDLRAGRKTARFSEGTAVRHAGERGGSL